MAENPIADTCPGVARDAGAAAPGRVRSDYGCSMTSNSVPGTNFRLTDVDWTNTV